MRFGPGHRSEPERNRKDLTLEDALALKAQIPEIRGVSPERYLFDGTTPLLKYRDRESNAPIVVGAYPDYALANNHFVDQGRFITESDVEHASPVAVIGTDVQKALFPRESPLDKTVEMNGWKYTIVGVMEDKGGFFGGSNNQWFIVPFSTFDHQFPQIKASGGDTIHIATVPYRPDQVQTVIEKGRALLRARRHVPFNKEDDFYIMTPDQMIESFQGITRGITGAMIFIAMISLLIGGVGVMNIMLVSVTERTREIGVRKAVGAFRRDIVLQFLTEATTLALLGGVIGVVVGFARAGLDQADVRRPAGGDAAVVGPGRPARLDERRDLLRALPGGEGLPAGSDRGAAVRVAGARMEPHLSRQPRSAAILTEPSAERRKDPGLRSSRGCRRAPSTARGLPVTGSFASLRMTAEAERSSTTACYEPPATSSRTPASCPSDAGARGGRRCRACASGRASGRTASRRRRARR